MIKVFKFIVCFSLILYLCAFLYLKFKHPFWFSQPVTQYTDLFKIEGIITKNIPKPIVTKGFEVQLVDTTKKENIQNIQNLLNTNYNIDDSYHFNYDEKYLNWSLNVPYKHYNITSENKWSLGIYDKNKLIAFINGKPIDLYLNNTNLPTFYIDYLCIDKQYRKKNLAQSIITHMANNGFVDYFKMFIFKKELFPLPFRFISNYNYYIIETKNINNNLNNTRKIGMENIKKEDIQKIYLLYINNLKKHRLYNKLHYEEFIHYLNNENISFYVNKNGNIDFFVAIYDSKINYNSTKTSDFLFIIIQNKKEYNNIINEIINKEKGKYNYSLINDTSENNSYIKENKLEKISNCYLHLYNYHYDNKFENKDVFFTIP